MDRKAELLRLIQQAYTDEQNFIAGLSGEERYNPGSFERWCAKDIIVHNAAWKNRMVENFDAVAKGLPPFRFEDLDDQNAEFYDEYSKMTWEEAQQFANQAYHKLLAGVESLRPESLESFKYFPWQADRPLWRHITGTGYTHPVTHLSAYYRQRGDPSRASAIVGEVVRQTESLDDSPAWQGVVRYNAACQYALSGSTDEAIAALRQAFALAPDLVAWSQEDDDLASLRDQPGFQALFARPN